MKNISSFIRFSLVLFGFGLLLGACGNKNTVPIELSWRHIGNDLKPGTCVSEITITNTSKDTLRSNWTIFWNQMSVEPITIEGEQIHVTQIQASYHSVAPTECWQPLAPDSFRSFTLMYKGVIRRQNNAPQGAFIVIDNCHGCEPMSININYDYSTDGHEFRRTIREFPYADGEEVYKQNERFTSSAVNTSSEAGVRFGLIPQPKEIIYHEGVCEVGKVDEVEEYDSEMAEESYKLVISPNEIKIIAKDDRGIALARVTLAQLVNQYDYLVPCAEIYDYPDTHYRGLMLDIARNFTNKEEILKVIDLLAVYKMNTLHLHLTDDEGWRIEIPGLPELTEVGSKRGFTTDERDCLYPMYSGGWNPNDKKASGNGYLTRQDFIEILRYAQYNHIMVIPEIDMPGHSRAAIKAMEARYWKYINTDKEKAEEYLLSDFQDSSKYVSAQHYTDNVICIALPSCYTFCKKVIDEVVAMYKEANAPLSIFHVGGDEVPRGAWFGSPKVQEYVASLKQNIEGVDNNLNMDGIVQTTVVTPTDIANLKDSFLETINAILAGYGLQTAGWEEVAYRHGTPNPRFVGKNIITYAWNSVPEWRGDEKPYQLANAGYPVMICSVGNLYLDMCYVNHEEERGLNWGGYVDEYNTFDLRADSLYLSVRRTMKGEVRDIEEYVHSGKTELIPDSAKNIIGIQAELWSETIRNAKQLEQYLLPKLIGTAQSAWSFSWQGDYLTALNDYNRNLYAYHIPHLVSLGYAFHLSQPGIHREGNMVYMNKAVAGAEIRYTTDGTLPTEQSPLYTHPFESDAELINACCFYLGERSNVTHSR